ncbi:nucleotidyltransferase domain-containing protein [Thermoanaerobacterium sp. CMT5567-10]|uniref:type VII toxin-antitoxin system MntA family adenylyltransferase antitoxin n=1 Tax=Thermoanaerobacterium sp. CMT5567-10 TaxID=3061989 RepID=UPI0026E06125|nr:nucleotidyltransferase domain-containing protein [Thermoanaerobacterium sp. CMT5567-10]WKV10282.1 nucleotidyltransferase domain-containing protein [Thermoanaerobacterium sp. CMT5567-10]
MRNLTNIKKQIDLLVDYVKENHNILALYIFGSYGTEYQNENSDIDFAVLYERMPSLNDELSLEVKFSEILGTDDIDLINLNKASLEFKHKVIYTGDLLYCRDYLKLADFKENVFKFYGDYGITMKFFYDDYLKGLNEIKIKERD